MKGWTFTYFPDGPHGREEPLPEADLKQAEEEYEKEGGAKIVSLGKHRLLKQRMMLDQKGPLAIIHILSSMPQYRGIRIDATEAPETN